MRKKPFIIVISITLFVSLLAALAYIFYGKEIFILEHNNGYDNSSQTAVFHDLKVSIPGEITQTILSFNDTPADVEESDTTVGAVLGSSSKEKRIEVDLTKQKLYAYEGSKKKMSFDVSTGKWGKTPTGEFRIWIKLKYTLMAGGSKALGTYYYLPNVPFTMYFYQDYGLHGAYWHNNFGHPMSHGCVNMRPADAEKLFYWAGPSIPDGVNSVMATKDNPGTKVIIYGTAPNN